MANTMLRSRKGEVITNDGEQIGLIESVFSQFMASTWTEAIIYAIFLIILFVKPSGFFGHKQDW